MADMEATTWQRVTPEEVAEEVEKNRRAQEARRASPASGTVVSPGRASFTTRGRKVGPEEVAQEVERNRLAREGKGGTSEEEIAALAERNGD